MGSELILDAAAREDSALTGRMSGLGSPTARVMIVAVSNYAADSKLQSYRSIGESARQLERALKERCGVASERMRMLIDPTAEVFRAALEEEADKAVNGVFFFYYMGHGLLQTVPGEKTFLALAAADTAIAATPLDDLSAVLYEPSSIVRFDYVRGVLASLKHHPTVAILDCCFSATAARGYGPGAAPDFVSSAPSGDYLLAAAGPNEFAFGPDPDDADDPAEPTWFTGALVRLLYDGDPSLPALITLEDCYKYLRRLAANSPHDRVMPEPRAIRSGEIGQLVLTDNRAVSMPEPLDPPPPADLPCPYMGLAPYRAQDAELFCGRTDALRKLMLALPACAATGAPLIVTGASGVGKSSLVHAGLVPSLERDQVPGLPATRNWPLLTMIPDSKPLGSLAALLARNAGERPDAVTTALRANPESVTGYVDRIVYRRRNTNPADRLVLIVDQFEEVFTQPPGDRRGRLDRDSFVRALQAAARGTPGNRPAVVIIVIRGDHFVSCSSFPGLLSADPRNDLVIQPMTDDELRAVITEPAQQTGLLATPQLVERLLADLRMGSGPSAESAGQLPESQSQGYDAAGILPLVSHALERTFAKREGRLLTLNGYQASGGIWEAVAKTADDVYGRLEKIPQGQTAARLLLLDMVQLGRNADDSRRKVELDHDLGDAPARTVEQVARVFAGARLVTLDRTPEGQTTATLTHEAILRSWPTLRGWIEADRAGLLTRQQLMDAVREWQRNAQDSGRLYRGARLAATWQWAREPHHWRELSADAQKFLRTSMRSEREEQRRARRARIAIRSALAVVLVAVAAFVVFQHNQADVLRHQRDVAISEQAAASAETLRSSAVPESMLLALSAYHLNANQETRSALLDTFSEDATTTVLQPLGQLIQTGALSPAAPVMALGAIQQSADKPAVTLWNVRNPMHPRLLRLSLLGPSRGVEDVVFSPNGRLLVAATDDGDGGIWVWQLDGATTGTIRGTRLPGSDAGFDTAVFSSDGRWLAAGKVSGQSTALAWNLSRPAQPAEMYRALPASEQNAGAGVLAFAPGTHTLYTAMGDGSIWSWKIGALSNSVQQVLPSSEGVTALAFDRAGGTLAVGRRNGQLSLWRVSGGAVAPVGQPIDADQQAISAIAFSPDGRTIATGADDWSVKIWTLPSLQPVQTLRMDAVVYSVAFAADSSALLAVDGASNAELWEVPGAVITGPTGQVNSIAVSPAGNVVAAASDDGTVRLWRVSDSHHYIPLGRPHQLDGEDIAELASAVAFSPNGRLLAIGDVQGSIYLWNVSNPSHPVPLGRPVAVPGTRIGIAAAYTVTSLAFVPRHNVLIVGDGDGSAYFVNISHPSAPTGMFSLTARGVTDVNQVAVNAAGDLLAYATNQGIYLSDIANLSSAQPIGQLMFPNGAPDLFNKVAFSHHGNLLVTGGPVSNTEQVGALYDLSNPQEPRFLSYISGPSNNVYSFAFSPDDKTLAGGSADTDVWLWNVSDPAHPAVEASLAGHTQWVTSVAYAANNLLISASADTTIRLWDTSISSAISAICSYYPGTAYFPVAQWDRWFNGLTYQPPCTGS